MNSYHLFYDVLVEMRGIVSHRLILSGSAQQDLVSPLCQQPSGSTTKSDPIGSILLFGITAAGLWYTFTQTQTEQTMPSLVLSNLFLERICKEENCNLFFLILFFLGIKKFIIIAF